LFQDDMARGQQCSEREGSSGFSDGEHGAQMARKDTVNERGR
jgi:hypothetical protein